MYHIWHYPLKSMANNTLRLADLGSALPLSEGGAQLSSVSDPIYQALREAILSVDLPPDMHLTETFIARRFGVSVTPVREALQRLVHAGLAVRQTAKGVKVRRLTEREVKDIYELRVKLEPMALRQSIPNLTGADLKPIERILSQAKRAIEQGDLKNVSRLNSHFHSQLLMRADNKLLLAWLDTLADWRRLIAMQEWSAEDRSRQEWEEHRAIFEAVRAKDVAGSETLLVRHISHFL